MGWLLNILLWAMLAANYYAYCLRKNLTIPELRDTVTNFMVWFNLANVAIALLIFAVTY
jgi:hypothetical protein